MEPEEFEIRFVHPSGSDEQTLRVNHTTETFDFDFAGSTISLINNGDNSWSLVNGNIDQETVNLVGDAIEKKFGEEV